MELLTWCRLHADRLAAFALMVGGAVLIVAGWIGVSGEVYIANQVPYVISGGIGGLAMLIVAATLWLSSDMNDEWHELDRLDAQQSDLQRGQEALDLRLSVLEEQNHATLNGRPTRKTLGVSR